MTLPSILLVLLGAFFGGALRYGFIRILPAPVCTFAANLTGSLAIGLAYGALRLPAGIGEEIAYPLLIVGFAGGLSTWSTFAKELGEMLKEKRYWNFIQYLFWSIGLGIAAAWLGAEWVTL